MFERLGNRIGRIVAPQFVHNPTVDLLPQPVGKLALPPVGKIARAAQRRGAPFDGALNIADSPSLQRRTLDDLRLPVERLRTQEAQGSFVVGSDSTGGRDEIAIALVDDNQID